jgi:hypothetical protein
MYRIDTNALTVIHTDRHGEDYDLNAEGEPCATVDDLRDFVGELLDQGMLGTLTRKGVVKLREEASYAGDGAQAAICDLALDGDPESIIECANVVGVGRAQ